MAIVCDFRECQKVLESSEQHTMTVNDNSYVICARCEEKFKEYLTMYLFKPSAIEAPRSQSLVAMPLPVEFVERKFVPVTRPEYSTNRVLSAGTVLNYPSSVGTAVSYGHRNNGYFGG